jgi:HEAT repeat protein
MMLFNGRQYLYWQNLQRMVSRIVEWQRHSSFEFAAVFQDAIMAAIPAMVELLRDQNSAVQRRAISSLVEFAKHSEQDCEIA